MRRADLGYFGGYLVHYVVCRNWPPSTGQIQRAWGPLLGVTFRLRRGRPAVSAEHAAMVLLQHGLDWSPHRLLREAVCPGGYLPLIGINPRSLWGIRWLFRRGCLALCLQNRGPAIGLTWLGFAPEKRRLAASSAACVGRPGQSRLACLSAGMPAQSRAPVTTAAMQAVVGLVPAAPGAALNRAVRVAPAGGRKSAGEIPNSRHDMIKNR